MSEQKVAKYKLKRRRIASAWTPRGGMGPTLWGRFGHRAKILYRVGCLLTFQMREVAIGTLALANAVYGAELVDVGRRNLTSLEAATVRALWARAHVWP